MSDITKTSQSTEEIAGQAATWLVRLQSDAVTESDFEAFTSWVANPGNREVFHQIEMLDADFDTKTPKIIEALDARTANANPTIVEFPRKRGGISRRLWLGGALAAGLALFAATTISQRPVLQWTAYQTAKGETRTVNLADGSVIRLNGASSVRVAFAAHERRVEMSSAEASFDVAKDPNRPFLIAAGNWQIRVVGTEFNVFHFDGATRVTVRRGVVQVRPIQEVRNIVSLTAGQEFSAKDNRAVVRPVDPDAAFAWQTGRLVYDEEPLLDVASALSRHFTIPIRVDDSAAGLRFSGLLTLDSEDAVVRRLEAFLPVQAEKTDGAYVLKRRHGS